MSYIKIDDIEMYFIFEDRVGYNYDRWNQMKIFFYIMLPIGSAINNFKL